MTAIADYFAWLKRTVPEVSADLRPPAEPAALDALARHIGFALPDAMTQLYRLHDGQHDATRLGVIYGLEFLPLAEVTAEWDSWAELRGASDPDELDRGQYVFVPNMVADTYTTPGWLPLFRCPGRADYIGVDLNPDPEGTVGQVINFGRDEPEKYVAARGLEELFELLMEWVQEEGVGAEPLKLRDHVEDLFAHGGRVFERLYARASGEDVELELPGGDDEDVDDDDDEIEEIEPPPELRAPYEALLDKLLEHLRDRGRAVRAATLELERTGDITVGGLELCTGGDWVDAGTHELTKLSDALLTAAESLGRPPRIDLLLWRDDNDWHHKLNALG